VERCICLGQRTLFVDDAGRRKNNLSSKRQDTYKVKCCGKNKNEKKAN